VCAQDMMEVGNLNGMGGKGHNISLGLNESRSHFGAWAAVSSPMIIGMDITNSTNLGRYIPPCEIHAWRSLQGTRRLPF
jgi:hypothetical protein